MPTTKTTRASLAAIRRARRATGTIERLILELEHTKTRLAAAKAKIKKQDDTIYYLARLMKRAKLRAGVARREMRVLKARLEGVEGEKGGEECELEGEKCGEECELEGEKCGEECEREGEGGGEGKGEGAESSESESESGSESETEVEED